MRSLQLVVDHGLRPLYSPMSIWLPLRDPYRWLLIVTDSTVAAVGAIVTEFLRLTRILCAKGGTEPRRTHV
jgi:hypothetical protein